MKALCFCSATYTSFGGAHNSLKRNCICKLLVTFKARGGSSSSSSVWREAIFHSARGPVRSCTLTAVMLPCVCPRPTGGRPPAASPAGQRRLHHQLGQPGIRPLVGGGPPMICSPERVSQCCWAACGLHRRACLCTYGGQDIIRNMPCRGPGAILMQLHMPVLVAVCAQKCSVCA